MLSLSFTNWALSLDDTERVLVPAAPAKRNETFAEFFANRSSK